MLKRSFTQEQGSITEGSSEDRQEPEYIFEGFTVEFSEKIMLTPLTLGQNSQNKGQVTP
jgi:hypothetical protein